MSQMGALPYPCEEEGVLGQIEEKLGWSKLGFAARQGINIYPTPTGKANREVCLISDSHFRLISDSLSFCLIFLPSQCSSSFGWQRRIIYITPLVSLGSPVFN